MKPEDQQDLNFAEDKDRILRRVKKMLTLGNDPGAAEGERDNAMRMAHATLAKYGLSMAEAERTGTGKQEDRRQDVFVMVGHAWSRTVVDAVAKLFFCEYIFLRLDQRFMRNYIIGRLSNVATAIEISKFVIASIEREARLKRREQMQDGGWERSFCKGAAARIWVRCDEIRRTAEKQNEQQDAQQPTTGTALVLASLYKQEEQANTALVAQLHPKVRIQPDRQKAPVGSAYQQGRAFGNKVSLNRQVESKTQGRIK